MKKILCFGIFATCLASEVALGMMADVYPFITLDAMYKGPPISVKRVGSGTEIPLVEVDRAKDIDEIYVRDNCDVTSVLLDIAKKNGAVKLHLEGTSVNDGNAKKIRELLEKNNTVQTLIISLGKEMPRHELPLTNTGLNDILAGAMASQSLKRIQLDVPYLRTEDFDKQYAVLRAECGSNLKKILISKHGSDDKILVSLKQLRNMTDVESVHWLGLQEEQLLEKDYNAVFEALCKYLKSQKGLKKLIIRDMNDNVAPKVRELLSTNVSISELFVLPMTKRSFFKVTNNGFKEIAAGVAANSNISCFEFKLPLVQERELHKGISSILRLRCGGGMNVVHVKPASGRGFRPVSLRELQRAESVSQICVYDDSMLAESMLNVINNKVKVKSLHFLGRCINDRNVKKLKEVLATNHSIEKLTIISDGNGNSSPLTDVGFADLKCGVEASRLGHFEFNLPCVSACDFQQWCARIEPICLGRNKKSNEAVMVDAEGYDKYGWTSLKELSEAKHIESIQVRNDGQLAGAVLDIVAGSNVKELKFFGSSINDNNIGKLATVLKTCPKIRRLKICSEGKCSIMKGYSIKKLEEGVVNSSLKKIDLQLPYLEGIREYEASWTQMMSACEGRRNDIVKVKYAGEDRDNQWVGIPWKKLKTEQGVEQVHIFSNYTLTKPVLDTVKHSKDLKRLYCERGSIDDDNVDSLRDLLKENKALKFLSVKQDECDCFLLTDDGFKKINKAVVESSSLLGGEFRLPGVDMENVKSEYLEMNKACADRCIAAQDKGKN